jgi:hypothetical protein
MSADTVDAAADLLAFDFMSNRLPPSASSDRPDADGGFNGLAPAGTATPDGPKSKKRKQRAHDAAPSARTTAKVRFTHPRHVRLVLEAAQANDGSAVSDGDGEEGGEAEGEAQLLVLHAHGNSRRAHMGSEAPVEGAEVRPPPMPRPHARRLVVNRCIRALRCSQHCCVDRVTVVVALSMR